MDNNKDQPVSDDLKSPTPPSPDLAPDQDQDQPTAHADVPVEKMKTLNISNNATTKNTNKIDKASRLGGNNNNNNNNTRPARCAQSKGSFAPPSASSAGSAAKIQQFAATLRVRTPEAQAGPSRGDGGGGGGGDGDGVDDELASLVLMLAARKTGRKAVGKGEARESVRKAMEK